MSLAIETMLTQSSIWEGSPPTAPCGGERRCPGAGGLRVPVLIGIVYHERTTPRDQYTHVSAYCQIINFSRPIEKPALRFAKARRHTALPLPGALMPDRVRSGRDYEDVFVVAQVDEPICFPALNAISHVP